MTKWLMVFAVLLCMAVPAQGAVLEEAGVAIVQPLSANTPSFLAWDVSGKIFPIEEPEALTLETLPQYVGAKLHGHILVHSASGNDLPLDINDMQLAAGISLPLIEAGSDKVVARAGPAYNTNSGLSVFACVNVAL